VSENRVLRRIFRPERNRLTQEWRRLHNEQLYALCFSPNIIRVIKSRRLRWTGYVAHIWKRRGVQRVMVGKYKGRRPLERPIRNGRIILQSIFEKWYGGMDWNDLAQDRDRWRALVNAVMNLRVP
jgi:hypothetical protein